MTKCCSQPCDEKCEHHLLPGADKFWKDKELAQAAHDVMMGRSKGLKRDLEAILGETLDNKSILDLGCGGGRIYKLYEPSRYVGVDQSGLMLMIAEEECLAKIEHSKSEVELHCSDLVDFQTEEHFDIALMLNVLQHVTNPLDLVNHMMTLIADTYVIEFFLNVANKTQYHDTSVGRTSVSRPRAFVDDVANIMESNGLRTATLVRETINTNVAPVFVAGWRI